MLLSTYFIDGEVKAFIIYKNYKLVTHLSTENIPKGKTNPRQPEWTMGCIDSQEAVLVWLIGEVSRGSAGEYQADERAGVAQLSWRVSGR